MNKGSNNLWGGRFEKATAQAMARLSKSTHFDWRLAKYDLLQTDVHIQALNKVNLLTKEEAEKLRQAVSKINIQISSGEIHPLEEDEDVHSVIERLIINEVGEIGGKIRVGRSRNDQIVTDFKLFLRESSRHISDLLLDLISIINKKSEKYVETAVPGFTHMQHAQPVTLAHELTKHCQSLLRDIDRFIDWDKRVDDCPLGSGALSGSAIITDSTWVAKQLGFSKPSENSIDAVSDRDFVAEYLFICAMVGIHLSKFAEEIIIFSSSEFSYAKLSDEFSTGSSIMPQKKNPDAAELTRGKSGRLIGNLTAMLVTLKGLAFAYNRDLQEDKEPVFDSHDTLNLLLPAFSGMVETLDFDTDRLTNAAVTGHSLATEIADWLVKNGTTFKDAHEISGQCVKLAESKGIEVHELDTQDLSSIDSRITSDIKKVLNLKNAIESRTSYAGTSPSSVKAQIKRISGKIEDMNKWAQNNPVPEL